ncbi:ORC1-type DNA replication protein 2 [Sulfuracidifex tepidarius]|uniref:ORC1-type DNA replication protein n=1 Tax=Sulfuracidifex tepidarius TaxID=1294262 RepID=A0A510E3Q7_9CREN|nr:ORC1-type DNA replication protein 2 [Sulfuracidifex tepidarius]BBG26710.1 ORC1-type DNA replication protein 2 [Sulfuracidifex tepidarius]
MKLLLNSNGENSRPTTKDILNDVISSQSSIFSCRKKLELDYVPSFLPHREDKIKELGIVFKDILNDGYIRSIRTVVMGKTGTGKTATTSAFENEFKKIANERGSKVEIVHVNCHKQRTLYLISLEIANRLRLPVPTRGLSSQEIFKIIHDYLEKRNMHLILTLDEFNQFIDTAPQEEIYFLARIYDEISATTKRISYIFIVNDPYSLYRLDKSIKDHIVQRVIEFSPYSSNELFDILKARTEEAFVKGAILDDALRFISDIYGQDKGGSGNARAAIETLVVAGEIAEKQGAFMVTVEHAKEANGSVNPEVPQILDNLVDADLHQLLIIKALIQLVKRNRNEEVQMGTLENEYQKLCIDFGEEPRKHTQIYENIRRLRQYGVLNTRQSGKGMRGRTTLISFTLPLDSKFEDFVNSQIRGRMSSR